MNSELIKTLAADAIGKWARKNIGSCVLSVKDGIVVASKPTFDDQINNRPLIITRFSQNAGLTHSAWNIVGSELFDLYNKEKSCQPHPKP